MTIGMAVSLITCSGMPVSTHTGVVQKIVIEPSSFDLNTTIHKNDEVQWVNNRQGPIQIVFLDSLEGKVNCKRGFGLLDLVNATTLKPQDSVSLCFAEAGVLRYTVHLDRAMPTGWLNVPGRISVESASETN
jgi:hypothetical protein